MEETRLRLKETSQAGVPPKKYSKDFCTQVHCSAYYSLVTLLLQPNPTYSYIAYGAKLSIDGVFERDLSSKYLKRV